MAKLLNKMLNFVGWEEEEEIIEEEEETRDEPRQQNYINTGLASMKSKQNKVVNIHSASQLKVVIMQPESIEEAKDVCDHLKNKKPIVVNLEDIEKESAQRIVDFLSGSVYALDGHIQKVAGSILLVTPNNVDIMGDFKEELKNKGVFPWVK
ncbi:MAG: cell division protein SepF [Clostridia bacterium]|nr:cell division protein SepF [Clostridia bacterium]